MRRPALLLAIALALVAAAARAQPYVRSTVKKRPDLPLFWKQRCLSYHVGAAGSARTPARTEWPAIDAAFASWQREAEQCGNGWSFVPGEPIRVKDYRLGIETADVRRMQVLFREVNCRDVVGADDPCAADPELAHTRCANEYQCLWVDPRSQRDPDEVIGLTLTTYKRDTGEILDADTELNGTPELRADGSFTVGKLFTSVDGPVCVSLAEAQPSCVAYDIQNTLTHEIGHALGFDHSQDPDSTMFASADFGEVSKRAIDPGTRQGFCSIYPRADDRPSCDSTGASQQALADRRRVVGETVGCSASESSLSSLVSSVVLWGLRRRRRTATWQRPL